MLYSQNLFSKISFKANYDQVNNVVQLNIQNSLPDFDLKTITASFDYKNKNSGALVDQSFFTTDLSSIVERNGGTLLEEFGCADTPTAKARWVLIYIHFQIYSKAYKTNEIL